MENSRIYKIVNEKRLNKGLTTTKINEKLGKTPSAPNVQRTLKSGSIKLSLLIGILNILGLELIVRDPETGEEIIVNKKTK